MDFETAATLAQASIDHYFGAPAPQAYNNVYPLTSAAQNQTFNYWWIAHLVDVQLDAYLRTGAPAARALAEATYAHNKAQNHGTLLHEFYDDQLWNALAALRLYRATGKREYLEDATAVCQDIFATAWNDTMGGGFAWRRAMPGYKNTPANAPVMILALRLYQLTLDSAYLTWAQRDLAWMQQVLVDPATQFVTDGVNRLGDGRPDDAWQFSYNQGVYIGALVEFHAVSHDPQYLDYAIQCARTTIARLGASGTIQDGGDGGDEGLFKGIFYRYLALLLKVRPDHELASFVATSCRQLLAVAVGDDGFILAPRDWRRAPKQPVNLSDQLSAVMALEAAACVTESSRGVRAQKNTR
ncbi:glycoside hydrolase family 76 protein [Lacticaseibacillus kribbianus]|uniref:glycoside hydrolase family 76 protein n=1 Tax=Lacticaseibacillus kribbianus TaxID=2926292 RepID=UPI001CD404F1|nr:glycoside hydrolase family 76 protein [Lacticaseibacillus kribbianus]